MKSARPSCTASRTFAPMKNAVWRKRCSSSGAHVGRRAQREEVDDLVVGEVVAGVTIASTSPLGSAAPEPMRMRRPGWID